MFNFLRGPMFYQSLSHSLVSVRSVHRHDEDASLAKAQADRFRAAMALSIIEADLVEATELIGCPKVRRSHEMLQDVCRLKDKAAAWPTAASSTARQLRKMRAESEHLLTSARFDPAHLQSHRADALKVQWRMLRQLQSERLGERATDPRLSRQLTRLSQEIQPLEDGKGFTSRSKWQQLQRDLDVLTETMAEQAALSDTFNRLEQRFSSALAVLRAAERQAGPAQAPWDLAPLVFAHGGLLHRRKTLGDPRQASVNWAFAEAAEDVYRRWQAPLRQLDAAFAQPITADTPPPQDVKALQQRLGALEQAIRLVPRECPDDVLAELSERQASLRRQVTTLIQLAPLQHPSLVAEVDRGITRMQQMLQKLSEAAGPDLSPHAHSLADTHARQSSSFFSGAGKA